MSEETNDQMSLIGGMSGTGKSTSLRDIPEQEKWFYLNTEAGKRLPFKNNYQTFRIEDPYQVHEAFEHFTDDPDILGGIVDGITFMMDMFETIYIYNNSNTQKAWADYQQFFKRLMQDKVVKFGKPVLMTAHPVSVQREFALDRRGRAREGCPEEQRYRELLLDRGLGEEAHAQELEGYESDLLTITEDDELLGYKHVFQTRPTKQTIGERVRSRLSECSPRRKPSWTTTLSSCCSVSTSSTPDPAGIAPPPNQKRGPQCVGQQSHHG